MCVSPHASLTSRPRASQPHARLATRTLAMRVSRPRARLGHASVSATHTSAMCASWPHTSQPRASQPHTRTRRATRTHLSATKPPALSRSSALMRPATMIVRNGRHVPAVRRHTPKVNSHKSVAFLFRKLYLTVSHTPRQCRSQGRGRYGTKGRGH